VLYIGKDIRHGRPFRYFYIIAGCPECMGHEILTLAFPRLHFPFFVLLDQSAQSISSDLCCAIYRNSGIFLSRMNEPNLMAKARVRTALFATLPEMAGGASLRLRASSESRRESDSILQKRETFLPPSSFALRARAQGQKWGKRHAAHRRNIRIGD